MSLWVYAASEGEFNGDKANDVGFIRSGSGVRSLQEDDDPSGSSESIDRITEVDLLMFYTADSLQSQELNGPSLSSSEMKTFLKTYTNSTNEALTNSMIDLRINLVHTQM
ncbi:unnamed protein product, partial [Pylaiella littoralis]